MKYFFTMRMQYGKYLLLCLLTSSALFSDNSCNVNALLEEYSQKNLLCQKTIDANKGHLVLFTREKLEKMHAKTLKDVFKTTPAIYYHENRYGLVDPLSTGSIEPYRSNFVRLYVDGVEITQGWAGSGLLLYGDINIDFVDHIEFYYMTPSFESSVEPAFLTIFLYSKDPKRDSGGKVNLISGSRGYNEETFSYGEQREDFSYMVNISHTDAKRKKIDNGTSTPLSRDFERLQLFSYIKSDDQIFHLQIVKKDTDSLAGGSWDATPQVSEMDYLNLHMDYGIDLTEEWHALLSYDWLRTDTRTDDELPLVWTYPVIIDHLDSRTENSTVTAELTYKTRIGQHRINAGIKGRDKKFDSVFLDGHKVASPDFDSEKIASLYFQDQYALNKQQLLSIGISYNHIERDGQVSDDSLLQLRLGYIYTSEHWSYKAYLYRTQFALEPLMRYFYPDRSQTMEAQTTLGVTQEIAYEEDHQRIRLILHMMQDEESLLQNIIGKPNNTKYFTSIVNYDYDFDRDNKVNLQLYYARYEDIFDFNELHDISGYFSLFNRYGDFDFYNGVVWHRNSLDWKNYFDWTSSITWNISDSFTLTLKGDNILNKAKETNLYRFDISSGVPVPITPLSISPIDQSFMIELEYMF
jgi:iron complex outermembrane receptor protein